LFKIPMKLFIPACHLALQHVQVDYTLPLAAIGQLLVRLTSEQVEEETGAQMPEDLAKEAKVAKMDTNLMRADEQAGTPSAFSCPECGGVLWEIQDEKVLRFRCRVGHGFSIESMMAEQSEALETALWVALKTLQESADISRRLAQHSRMSGQNRVAKRFDAKLQEAEQRIMLIKRALMKSVTVVDEERSAVEQYQNDK
jgi:two-component system chemotaxis response regulator CheB